MKIALKFFKKMLLALLALIVLFILVVVLFVNLSPQFGGKPTAEQLEIYKQSDNYKEDKFVNKNGAESNLGFGDFIKVMGNYINPQPNTAPNKNIEISTLDSLDIVNFKDSTRLVWFGHSTFLLQINNLNILIDPMFGETPSPVSFMGTKRFSEELPITIEQLPEIDLVLISHDHYDHLDYESIKKLKDKAKLFCTPLGVGAHLTEWGIAQDKIVEHDWWENSQLGSLNFVCTPAQHFSGRGFSDKAKTLWSSWIIESKTEKIFFSGDSGYSDHFKEIGKKYGPFDFAMLECGQYNELWPEIHMFPEETVQAGLDLKAERIMPIHWGGFKLSTHAWKDPINRFIATANEKEIPAITPKIGEPFFLKDQDSEAEKWWNTYE